MKDKSKVKDKNVWKVAKEVIKNPNITRREIQAKTWLHPLTIQKAKEELNQNGTKDPTIAYIVDKSKDRIKRAQRIFDRYLDEVEEKEKLERADTTLVKDIIKDDLARVTVLGGNVTDESGGLTKDKERRDNASVEDLLQFLKTK